MYRTSEEKLIEMNKSLIVDNNYLREELRAARARLAAASQAPSHRHADTGQAPPRDAI